MTSLGIIFILLLTVYINSFYEAAAEAGKNRENVRAYLREDFSQMNLDVQEDPRDPLTLLIVVPEDLLNFEFGKAALRSTAEHFLVAAMPRYAGVVCGSLRDKIDSIVIEGHTDDLGDDALNLRLSQERSFNVMVKGLEVIRARQPENYNCFQKLASASGRGKQDLVFEADSTLNRDKSRRVIFKIRVRSLEQLEQLSKPKTAYDD